MGTPSSCQRAFPPGAEPSFPAHLALQPLPSHPATSLICVLRLFPSSPLSSALPEARWGARPLKTRGELASADHRRGGERERGSLSTSEGTVHFDEPELELILRPGFSEGPGLGCGPGPRFRTQPPAPVMGTRGALLAGAQAASMQEPRPRLPGSLSDRNRSWRRGRTPRNNAETAAARHGGAAAMMRGPLFRAPGWLMEHLAWFPGSPGQLRRRCSPLAGVPERLPRPARAATLPC